MKKRNPWLYIPTQYFAEGLPYILINNLSVVMLKALGASNDIIGYTSLLYLPWSFKPLWAPWLDSYSTKRNWHINMQLAMALIFGLAAMALNLSWYIYPVLALFAAGAILSATHDIATDGYYLHTLDKKQQAFFTGIRSTFYRFSMIFGSGILVVIAGSISTNEQDKTGWIFAFGLAAALFVIFGLYHRFILPKPETDAPVKSSKGTIPFFKAFGQYFKQERIVAILAFILLYRLGEGLLVKMAQPFIMDSPETGGMGISVSQVGIMYGTFGTIALVIGGILGGILIKKYSLRKLIWPMALFMNLPNLLYVYMSAVRPDTVWQFNPGIFSFLFSGESVMISFYPVVQLCIIIEQFGYGLGFTAFMVYLLYVSKGEFKTTHYAISTGFMAVGMMIPGFLSGLLQMEWGYTTLFILSAIATIPGMLIIFILPMPREEID